jgi:hypothetical protein
LITDVKFRPMTGAFLTVQANDVTLCAKRDLWCQMGGKQR